jgi:hypothetical protein
MKDLADAIHRTFLVGLEKSLEEDPNSMPYLGLSLFTIRRSLVFFMVFALALFLGTKRRAKAPLAASALVLLMVGDLYSATYDINLRYDAKKFREPSGNIEFLQKDRSFWRFIASPATLEYTYRPKKDVYPNLLMGGKEMLYANRMMDYGLYDAFGYESIDRKRMSDVFFLITAATRSPDDTRVIDMMNIKYIVSPLVFKAKGYELVKKSEIANIYENKNVLPRAYLAGMATVIKKPNDIRAKFMDKGWDPRKEVVLEEEPVLKDKGLGVRGLPAGRQGKGLGKKDVADICYAFQEAALGILVEKTVSACIATGAGSVVVGGGVAANRRLREKLGEAGRSNGFRVFFPEFRYCLDNAAMIGVLGEELYRRGYRSDMRLNAEPNLKA